MTFLIYNKHLLRYHKSKEEFFRLFIGNMASELAHIDIPETCEPFKLFRDWIEEFKLHTQTNLLPFNLATSHNDAVKNRSVILQELSEEGLIFNSNLNSPKAEQLASNPRVAACFLFVYFNAEISKAISRQVRIEGIVEQLSPEIIERQYNAQPLFAKIRTNLIKKQGEEVKWEELKRKHDKLLEKVTKGDIELRVPNNFVSYKIVPKQFDFYHAASEEIADRVLFKNDGSEGWSHCHIAA